MPNINQDGNALSIGSAATAIQEVLDLGNQTTNPTDAQDESETPEEELEAQEDDEDAQPEMEADAEDEGEEGSDEGDELADEDEADSSDEEETYFTVQVDGEEMEVSQSELIAGYQKDADYRRKTQQLAEDKKAFEAEVENVSSKEQGLRQEYLNRLQQAEQIIVDLGGLQEPNWEELQAQDPVNFAWHQKQWQDKLGGLQRIRAERIALEQAQQKEQASNMQSFAVGELQKLQDTIPGWNDKSVAKAEMDEIAQHAQEVLGFTQEELSGMSDSRALIGLRNSYLYSKLMEKGTKAKSKVAGKRKVSKVLKSGKPVSKDQRSREAKKKTLSRLQGSGKIRDAADVIEAML